MTSDAASIQARRDGPRLVAIELLVLTLLAALTRFWQLFRPNAVVFDELHYERYAGQYLLHSFYYDVHPPLANLLYAAEARLFGVSSDTLIGGHPATVLRLLPALFGTLIVPLVYVIARRLGFRRPVATFAAFAALCDNALTADARLILLETLIIGFGLSAIASWLAARVRVGARRWGWLVASAFLAGCALSVKWTGASALGIILTAWLVDMQTARARPATILREGLTLVAVPAIVYLTVFAIHFHLLTRAGGQDAGLPRTVRSSLIGDPYYDSTAHPSYFTRLRALHHAMNAGNVSLEGVTHPAASPWYTWPIMKHPIVLWVDAQQPPSSILLLGNPVVWWGSLISVGIFLVARLRRRSKPRYAIVFLTGAFLLNYLPFIAITRVMYLYHYLFALLWLSMLATACLAEMAGWDEAPDDDRWSLPSGRSRRAYWGALALVLAGFLFFSPFTFGWHLSQAQYDARFWVLHPRF